MSRFIISIVLFLAVNILAGKSLTALLANNDIENKQVQERTWTQWALADFEKQKNNSAPIVILGSSLVLTPVNLADAKFSNSTVNGATHHTSDMLNSLLTVQSKNSISNFNFALPGLMPSDAYLITKLLLARNDKQKLIIYGVGPRDFIDNLLASPASTDPYRCLSKLLNQADDKQAIWSFMGNSWMAKMDYFMARCIPMYGEKEEVLLKLNKAAQKVNQSIVARVFGENKTSVFGYTVAQVHSLLPGYAPMSISKDQALFSPNPCLDPERFTKNLNEYRSRYRNVNWDTFTCQTKFFIDFLKTAHNNNYKVLVIAMPITSVNRQLLPDYICAAYKQNLSVLTKTYGADFVDLDSSGLFNDDDFGDTVHLGTKGSTKLIEAIADCIEKYNLLDARETEHRHLATAGVKL